MVKLETNDKPIYFGTLGTCVPPLLFSLMKDQELPASEKNGNIGKESSMYFVFECLLGV